MIITPLGHTEFLVDIENSEGRSVRILVDSWLSDYAVGDMMERIVKVRLDPEKCNTIDAIYISHSHCDHFDPYTLVEIYTYASPLLILPFTLRYLEGLISEYLPSARVKWLDHRETFLLHGIEITGYMWPSPNVTNEDDVMMLAISSARELLFAEIDTVPDMEDEGVMKSLYQVFTRREYSSACYIASRNCLEGQIPYYDLPEGKRKPTRDQYIAEQKFLIEYQYERYEYEEFHDFPDIFSLPGFVRGFVGQGIAYPESMSPELFSLSLWPLPEIASLESDMAEKYGYRFLQKALLTGRQYKIQNGSIEPGRKECSIGTLDDRGQRIDDRSRNISQSRIYASGPLFPRELSESDILEAKGKILDVLNHRFLPYWSASPVASLRDALIKNNGVYRIELKTLPLLVGVGGGTPPCLPYEGRNLESIIFEYSTARSQFIEIPYEENLEIDEDYWLLDLLDFLEGRQEMYSSFWHRLDPKRAYRLWTCLGATYMNHDLIERKYRYHFERAKNGEIAKEFVEDMLKDLQC